MSIKATNLPLLDKDISTFKSWTRDFSVTLSLTKDCSPMVRWCTVPFVPRDISKDEHGNEVDIALTSDQDNLLYSLIYKCLANHKDLLKLIMNTRSGIKAWQLLLERFSLTRELIIGSTLPKIFEARPADYASIPDYLADITSWRESLADNAKAGTTIVNDFGIMIWIKKMLHPFMPNLFAAMDATKVSLETENYDNFTAQLLAHLASAGDGVVNLAQANAAAAERSKHNDRDARARAAEERNRNETCRVCKQIGHKYCCKYCKGIGHSEERCKKRLSNAPTAAFSKLAFDESDFPAAPPSEGAWVGTAPSGANPSAGVSVLFDPLASPSTFEHDVCSPRKPMISDNPMDVIASEDIDLEICDGVLGVCLSTTEQATTDVFLTNYTVYGNDISDFTPDIALDIYGALYPGGTTITHSLNYTEEARRDEFMHGNDCAAWRELSMDRKTHYTTNALLAVRTAEVSHTSCNRIVPLGAITGRSMPLYPVANATPVHLTSLHEHRLDRCLRDLPDLCQCLCQHLCPQSLIALGSTIRPQQTTAHSNLGFHTDSVLAALSTQHADGTATVDSGANKLFCAARSDFRTYEHMRAHVTLASGTPQLLIHGRGWVHKQVKGKSGRMHTLSLPAYHAPSFHTDLVGVDTLNSAGIGCILTPTARYLELPDGDQVPITRSPRALFEFHWSGVSDLAPTNTVQSTALTTAITPECEASLIHQRLGHTSDRTAVCLRRWNLAEGVSQLAGTARPFCIACALTKSTAAAVPRTPTRHDDDRLFGTVFIDFKTMDCVGIGGHKYLLGFACRFRQTKVWAFPTSKRTILQSVHEFETMVQQYSPNLGVGCYRSDGALENVCTQFRAHCASHRIKHEITPPYMPQLNGNVEVCWRFLMQMVRAMHAHANLPKVMWPLTALAATFVKRLLPSSRDAITPHEIVTGHKPDHSVLRVFGCDAYAHRPSELRTTLDNTSRLTVFVGYAEPFSFTHPTWLVYDPSTKRKLLCDSVQCHETSFTCAASLPGMRTGKESSPVSTADFLWPTSTDSANSGNASAPSIVPSLPAQLSTAPSTVPTVVPAQSTQHAPVPGAESPVPACPQPLVSPVPSEIRTPDSVIHQPPDTEHNDSIASPQPSQHSAEASPPPQPVQRLLFRSDSDSEISDNASTRAPESPPDPTPAPPPATRAVTRTSSKTLPPCHPLHRSSLRLPCRTCQC